MASALACSGTASSSPTPDAGLPPTIRFDSDGSALVIATDPFAIALFRGDTSIVSAPQPVRLGRVAGPHAGLYVDPEHPGDGVAWTVPSRVTAVAADGDARRLTLDDGTTLRVAAGAGGGFALDVTAAAADLTRICLGLRPEERLFGFGETFSGVSHRGDVVPMQLRISPTSRSGTNEAHVPVPLAISPRGWAVLTNDPHPGAFDNGADDPSFLETTFATSALSVGLMSDPDPLALVQRAAATLGTPRLPPDWAFGVQQWHNAWGSSDEVLADARAMRDRHLPASAVWIDNPWQTGYDTFEMDPARFPDGAALIDDLHALGYRVVFWSAPYLDRMLADYAAAAPSYFVRLGNAPYTSLSRFGVMIDFSTEAATAWWTGLAGRIVALGADGFKLDYGEDIVPELGGRVAPWSFADGSGGDTMHARYAALYHGAYRGALPDGFLLARAGGIGGQTASCIWPGDLDSDFSRHDDTTVGGLPAAVSGALSLSASGYPFFASDTGGYRGGAPTKEVLIRWIEASALGTIFQIGPDHDPWAPPYDDETLAAYAAWARFHVDLFPYLFTYATEASRTGRPLMRPLALAFPADEAAWTRDDEWLLGDALLAAPIIEGGGSREVYLPAGTWIDWWTHAAVAGPATMNVDVPLDRAPLWIRAGSLLPMLKTPVDTLAPATDASVASYQDHRAELRVRVIPGGAASMTLFDGTTLSLADNGATISVTIERGRQFADIDVELLLGSAPGSVLVDGAPATWTPHDGFVTVHAGARVDVTRAR